MYEIIANLCDGNDYVAHWNGGTFDDLATARAAYLGYEPPVDEVLAEVRELVADGVAIEEIDLQVGLWDGDGESVEFESHGFDEAEVDKQA